MRPTVSWYPEECQGSALGWPGVEERASVSAEGLYEGTLGFSPVCLQR